MIKEYQMLISSVIVAVGLVIGGWLVAQNRRYVFKEIKDETSGGLECYDLNTGHKWSRSATFLPGTNKFRTTCRHEDFVSAVEEAAAQR